MSSHISSFSDANSSFASVLFLFSLVLREAVHYIWLKKTINIVFSECKIGREVIFLFQRHPSLTVSGVFFCFFIHLILGVYIYIFSLFLVYLFKNYKHIHTSSGFSPPYGARLYTFVSLLCGI